MVKYAIAFDNGNVSQHFGRCPGYLLVDILGKKLTEKKEIPNPGHRTGFIPQFLHEQGVNVMIAGGMGAKAVQFFNQYQIETIVGISGTIDNCINCILDGSLKNGPTSCAPGLGRGQGIPKEDGHEIKH
jgi:predicted Fe-Mo cluster-binding NifX family protein